ncbi:MAG: hypothetical protein GY729_22380 [Desulfobacteraceae bacterium]|nr:hypothetical protein [Desulfobacteraceae bacterium]
MCCHSTHVLRPHHGSGHQCQCSCNMQGHLSKKKKIQAMKDVKSRLEEKLDDVKEYIKELEKAK